MIPLNVTEQTTIFMSFIVAGIVSGVLFDFFRVMRKNFNSPNFLVYVEDFIFWILLGFIALFTAYLVSDGVVRVYMLLSMLCGALLYFFSLGKIIYKVFDFICRYISSIIRNICKLFRRQSYETKAKNT